MRLHVHGVGVVEFDGLTAQAVPALKLVSYHAPEMLLTGKLTGNTILVKIKDVDLSATFHIHNHRP